MKGKLYYSYVFLSGWFPFCHSVTMSNLPQSLILHSTNDKIICGEISLSLIQNLHLSAIFCLPHELLRRYCVWLLEKCSHWISCTHPTLDDYICTWSLADIWLTQHVFYLGMRYSQPSWKSIIKASFAWLHPEDLLWQSCLCTNLWVVTVTYLEP